MSLEQALAELKEAVLENTALLKSVMANPTASAATTTTATTEDGGEDDKPKRTRRTKEQIEADKAKETAGAATDAISGEEVKKKLHSWLGEFSKPEDKDNPDGTHPEVVARRDALRSALEKLTGKSTDALKIAIADADMTKRLDNWFESKAKVVDKGFGAGRFVADPAPAEEAEEEDDDMGI